MVRDVWADQEEREDPIIFRGLKSLTFGDSQQRSLLRLAAEGISVCMISFRFVRFSYIRTESLIQTRRLQCGRS